MVASEPTAAAPPPAAAQRAGQPGRRRPRVCPAARRPTPPTPPSTSTAAGGRALFQDRKPDDLEDRARQCYVTVNVRDTDFDASDEYVVGTTVSAPRASPPSSTASARRLLCLLHASPWPRRARSSCRRPRRPPSTSAYKGSLLYVKHTLESFQTVTVQSDTNTEPTRASAHWQLAPRVQDLRRRAVGGALHAHRRGVALRLRRLDQVCRVHAREQQGGARRLPDRPAAVVERRLVPLHRQDRRRRPQRRRRDRGRDRGVVGGRRRDQGAVHARLHAGGRRVLGRHGRILYPGRWCHRPAYAGGGWLGHHAGRRPAPGGVCLRGRSGRRRVAQRDDDGGVPDRLRRLQRGICDRHHRQRRVCPPRVPPRSEVHR